MKPSEFVFKYDKLRRGSDIRFRRVNELTQYQKTQRNEVLKRFKELQDVETAYTIRRTLDGTLLMGYESVIRIRAEEVN